MFNNISNKHAPLKILKTKNKPNKPWVTIGLKKSIKMRDKLYKQWLVTRDVSFYDRYKTYRNKIAIINKLYRTSYCNGILSEPNNSKKMQGQYKFNYKQKKSPHHQYLKLRLTVNIVLSPLQ